MTTQQFTQKYTIVQLLEPLDEGYEYSSDEWPLHTTLVDTFATEWSVTTLANELTKLLSIHDGATSVAMDDAFFGPEGQTQVVRLKKTASLVKLHTDLLALLEKGGLTLNDPHYARDGFLPHVTVQKHARLHEGDVVTFAALSIIDMLPDEDPSRRTVLKTISLP